MGTMAVGDRGRSVGVRARRTNSRVAGPEAKPSSSADVLTMTPARSAHCIKSPVTEGSQRRDVPEDKLTAPRDRNVHPPGVINELPAARSDIGA
ncbi:unnamed protein product [Heligmosomoides polygyrus]|uniref:Uncharacterized protein n=1 Tax=Heligmosomoides polygyrus TaxID=6339 RepID=A0A183G0D9_HELPZ|nr:unnamed protein product [Heligmosomoides polygyrus]